ANIYKCIVARFSNSMGAASSKTLLSNVLRYLWHFRQKSTRNPSSPSSSKYPSVLCSSFRQKGHLSLE
ncbi:MAG: hypothetical protein K8R45_02330, partial [Desulfobacterales bacterium]|nr:hypothetical protein [Desulfobacterales bacterium]